MNIQIVSDLHLEFFDNTLDIHNFLNSLVMPKNRDVLVIAGDLGLHAQRHTDLGLIISSLVFLSKNYNRVIYIPGNHEFYWSNFNDTHVILRKIESAVNNIVNKDRLHILIRDSFRHTSSVNFLGCTLWFNERPENFLYTHKLSDFEYIRSNISRFHLEGVRDLAFLKKNIDLGVGQVVVTHHLPSRKSLEISSTEEIYYVNDLAEKLCFGETAPKLWIHGHSHKSVDYRLGKTKIVSNPYGYIGRALNPNFDEHFCVEL